MEAGSRTQSALTLLDLGAVLENAAKFSEARSALQQSLALFSDLGHLHYVTQAHSFLGSIDMHSGRYQEAHDHAQTGLALAQVHGPRFCVSLNLLLLGCLDLAQGGYATAHQFLQDGVAVHQEVGQKDDLSLARACLAFAECELEDTRGARQHLFRAFETAVESGAVPPLLWVLPAMALVLAREGEKERAVELYALASRYPLVAKSRWFADVAGNQLATVAASLSAERVAVAEKRGQARDLKATVAELLAELGR